MKLIKRNSLVLWLELAAFLFDTWPVRYLPFVTYTRLLPSTFFGEQVNLETENRFVPLTKEKKGLHLVVQIKAALLVG